MAKKKAKKKMLKQQLESKRLENRTAFYTMVAALAVPASALLDTINMLLKHFLK